VIRKKNPEIQKNIEINESAPVIGSPVMGAFFILKLNLTPFPREGCASLLTIMK